MIDIKCFQAIHHLIPPGPISLDSDSEDGGIVNDSDALQEKTPKTTKRTKGKQEKKKKRNPSVIDSRNSTILLISPQESVKEQVVKFANSQRKDKSLKFHPIMVSFSMNVNFPANCMFALKTCCTKQSLSDIAWTRTLSSSGYLIYNTQKKVSEHTNLCCIYFTT